MEGPRTARHAHARPRAPARWAGASGTVLPKQTCQH